MKKYLFFISIITLWFSYNANAQITFDWETATDNGNNVTQTLSGITATVTGSDDDVDIINANGFAGSSGNVVYNDLANNSTSKIITFSQAMDVTSIFALDADGSGGATFTFTPTGGTNTAISEPISAAMGKTVNLNWEDVTAITITSSNGVDSFAIDDIVTTIPTSCSLPSVPTVTYTTNSLCDGNKATLHISGSLNDATEWKIYSGSCGGTLVGSTSTSSFEVTPNSTGTTYYVRGEGGCVTPSGCDAITVASNNPTVNSQVYYVVGDTPTPLTANASTGNTLNWYTAATGGTASTTAPTPSTAVVGITSYWVSQVDAGSCESIRTPINVIVTKPVFANFDWETATDNGNNVTQTVNGITATVTGSHNDVHLQDGGGASGSSGNVVINASVDSSTSKTITFSQAVDVTSIFALDADGSGGATFTFTPTGGSNSAVSETFPANIGKRVYLDWRGVTAITITSSRGNESFGIDDIVIPVSCSLPDTPSLTASNTSVCSGNTSTLNISGNLNDASEWRIYTGSCGGTLIGSTSTSNFVVTPTGTSTTYYIRGEGGCITTPGACGTITINVNGIDNADFSYPNTSYATNASDPTPTITGLAGGTFSSTTGLDIASNGIIDLSDSTPNTYVVTYTTAGSCPNSETFSVTITRSTSTWTGANNNSWEDASNWSSGSLPNVSDDIIIPNSVTNYPTISSAVTVNSINIASGASLIANAIVTGETTYTRNLPTTNWYLVAAPVSGETQEDIIANHTFATGSGSNIGLGAYVSSGTIPWVYANTASTGIVKPGAGFSMKLASAGDVSITGTLNTSNVSFPIVTGTRNNFDLIGNPYTSYINSSTFAVANTGLLSEETIWLWDGTQYVTYNAINPIEIAPTQGFFVEASSNGNVTFSTANQSHKGTDTFMRQTPKPNFELFVEENNKKQATKVFYVAEKTTGFDNGYDSKMFGGVNTDFAIFTQLVSNDMGKKLAIQTLPNANYETMVIPVGLIAKAGKELTISAKAMNLPQGIQIYLEDRKNGVFTNISEENYTFTLNEDANGIGQFYIHTSSKALSTETVTQNLKNVSIYKSSASTLTIAGLQTRKATINMYSVIGKEVFKTNFTSNGVQTVNLPVLASGVYLVKVSSELGNLSKKIIIE